MKSFSKFSCTIVCLLFLVTTIEAQSNQCNDKDINIYFGNGMNNTFLEAAMSTIALQGKLINQLPADLKIQYGLSYNKKEGQVSQLLQVARQKNVDDYSKLFTWFSSVDIAPQWFQDWMKETARKYDEKEYVVDSDLQRHIQRYSSDLKEGKPVIVVSHSQGNFYANRASGILNSKSFKIVAVATPSGFVAGNGDYTTLTNDRIINIVSGSLPANTTNNNSYEWTNHNFDKTYLNGNISGPQIINNIKNAVQKIELPNKEAKQGLITVTLAWGSAPDVDLHVFEPNGTHVYYNNPFGSSGSLDVDIVTSFGQEHYYVSCDSIAIGTYTIGVNYYEGTTPEFATVQIKAGNQIRSFSKSLPNEQGEIGDSNPYIIAKIEYFLNKETDKYEFNITSASSLKQVTVKGNESNVLSPKKYKTDKIFSNKLQKR